MKIYLKWLVKLKWLNCNLSAVKKLKFCWCFGWYILGMWSITFVGCCEAMILSVFIFDSGNVEAYLQIGCLVINWLLWYICRILVFKWVSLLFLFWPNYFLMHWMLVCQIQGNSLWVFNFVSCSCHGWMHSFHFE